MDEKEKTDHFKYIASLNPLYYDDPKKKVWVGIDPGVKGALAFMNEDESVYKTFYTPKTKPEIISLLKEVHFNYNIIKITIEDVTAGGGITATSGLMLNKGLWWGCALTLGIPLFFVHEKTWKKAIIKKKIPKGKSKEFAMEAAQTMYPLADIKLKKDDGKADALLICRYGKISP